MTGRDGGTTSPMTGRDIRKARAILGTMWGLDRPLRAAELGRLLKLSGRDPGRFVLNWQIGKHQVPGPVIFAIEALLAGYEPAGFRGELLITGRIGPKAARDY
jgi:hypothetical protein